MKREMIREWIPPKIWNWLRRRFSGFRIVKNWSSSTGSWHYAADKAAIGWDEGLRRMVLGKPIGFDPWKEVCFLKSNDKQHHDLIVQFALVVAKTAMLHNNLKILDYGGGFGLHELALSRFFPQLSYTYTVCELQEFCEKGKKINNRVHFVPCLEEAGEGFHLVYASSSIQYSHDWRVLITQFCKVTEGLIFVTRTPFVFKNASFITVQRAYGTEYPGWVLNFNDVVAEFSKYGFVLEEVFINGEGPKVAGVDEQNIHLGLLFYKG